MSTATKTQPVRSTATRNTSAPRGNQTFLFGRDNYMWMLAGLALIVLGFFLMAGGKSPDPNQFNEAEVYSARRITIAPIIILIGFGLEAYAIMKRPKNTNGA